MLIPRWFGRRFSFRDRRGILLIKLNSFGGKMKKLMGILLVSALAAPAAFASTCRVDVSELNFYNPDLDHEASVSYAKALAKNGLEMTKTPSEADYRIVERHKVEKFRRFGVNGHVDIHRIVLLSRDGKEVASVPNGRCRVGTIFDVILFGRSIEQADCVQFDTYTNAEYRRARKIRRLTRELRCNE